MNEEGSEYLLMM